METTLSARWRWFYGWLCMAVGLLPLLVGAGLLEPEPGSVHAPPAILILGGLVFVFGGACVLFGPYPALKRVCLTLLLVAMAMTAGWTALFAPADGFSGGIAALPRSANVLLARLLFALGALIPVYLVVTVWRKPIRRLREAVRHRRTGATGPTDGMEPRRSTGAPPGAPYEAGDSMMPAAGGMA